MAARSTGTEAQAVSQKTEPAQKQDAQGQNQAKRGEWLLAPIPISSPSIGSGLEWVVGYVFPFSRGDKVSPHSIVGIGGLVTDNGSHGAVLGGRLYLKENRYRLAVAGGHARINADIYGIGSEAGDAGAYLPLTTKGAAFRMDYGFGKVGQTLSIGVFEAF